MSNAAIPFEWFFDVLNKRMAQGIKLEDLFLCVPNQEECEFDFEIPNVFKHTKSGIIAQGNDLERDYPVLAKYIISANRKVTIKVFFIAPPRIMTCLILWRKKYQYPKVNRSKGHLVLTETSVRREINKANVINQLKAKYN